MKKYKVGHVYSFKKLVEPGSFYFRITKIIDNTVHIQELTTRVYPLTMFILGSSMDKGCKLNILETFKKKMKEQREPR